jgi:hypothetical protein
MIVTDADLTTLSTALAVIVLGQLESQAIPLVLRIEQLERQCGIESSEYDLQSLVPVEELAKQLRAAMTTALGQ